MGLVLSLVLMSGIASAQTESVASTDIPPELVRLAQDLGCETSALCAEKFDANIEQGIALAQKYDIYTPEQEKLAATFKTEVLERLRTANQDNFEEEILALADKILREKPALARTMGVTRQAVNAAETIISTVKDAGVNLRTCQKSPEDLSREQLIACVKASSNLSSKEKAVGDYIPKENAKAAEVQKMLELESSLLSGLYPGLGRVGAEEAGQICLKPGSESIADCDRIAEKFFGAEGVKHLQEVRLQTTRIKEYYTEGIERMELVTPDGQKLIGKGAIRNACDKAFEDSNLGLARACGNFAVKNGYATQAEIEDGLKLMETFSQKAKGVDFDNCRFNPESCRKFLPDEFRSQFDSQFEIFRIMSESIGFDPARCENSYDPDIGKRCLEGAKAALSRVEEIAKNSPEARRIVDEIRGQITEGERMTERRDEFHEESRAGGNAGPGGCRGPEECFKYCSQPGNSAECISFGAKSQIFDQSTIVQKFNMVNEQLNTPQGQPYPYPPQNNNTFPNQPGQVDPGFNRYPYPQQQPVGPSPECFAAIESGDFARAKTACAGATKNYPQPIAEPFPVCPAYSMPSPCPEGQMRQAASDARGCPSFGACTVIDNYKPIDTPKPCPAETYWDGRSCMANPEKDTTSDQTRVQTSCASGQWWDSVTQSCKSSQPVSSGCGSFTDQTACQVNPGCGWANGACGGNMTTGNTCPSGQYWYYPPGGGASYCMSSSNTACSSGQYWNGTACVTNLTTSGSCPSGYHSHSESGGFCMNQEENYSGTCYNSAGTATMTCPQQTYTPYGCGAYTSQTSCSSAPACSWQNNVCIMSGVTSGTTCTSGQWWDPATQSCRSSSNTACTSGQYWDGSACVSSSTTGQCPSGQYWYTPSGGGTGYCMSTSGTTCSSGQWWNGTACVTTSTTDCTSGQYWNGTACVSNSTTNTYPTPSYPTPSENYPTPSYPTPSSESYPTPSYPTPSENYPTPSYPTPSSESYPTPSSGGAMLLCNQSGGIWTGAACDLAENISDQKDYYAYHQKQSQALLAQVIRAFTDLFR